VWRKKLKTLLIIPYFLPLIFTDDEFIWLAAKSQNRDETPLDNSSDSILAAAMYEKNESD